MFGSSAFGASAFGATGQLDVTVSLTGVQGTGQIGTVANRGSAVVYPTGVVGYGRVTRPLVWGKIVPGQNANWTTMTVGNNVVWVEIPT